MNINMNHTPRTHRSVLLSTIMILTLVAVALATSINSDYAEALMLDRAFFGGGSSAKSSLVTPSGDKAVVKQAAGGQGMSGSLSGGDEKPGAKTQTTIAYPVSADSSTRTLTKHVLSDEGNELYVVTAIFGDDAEIPFDAQLEVEERVLTDEGREMLRQGLEITEDSTMIPHVVLDIRLVSGGVYVEPKTPIEVEIASTVITPADSYAIAAMRLEGTEAISVPIENLTGVDANNNVVEKPEYSRLKLNVGKMGEYALSTVLTKKDVWPVENETVTIWGLKSATTNFSETLMNESFSEGLTMLRRVRAQVDPSTSWASNLWVSAEFNAGAVQGFDGVRCDAMIGEELGTEVFGPSGSAQPVALPADTEYAFLWDDGYRTSTVEAGIVSFSGSMPLGVEVWADDANAAYVDASAVVGVPDGNAFGHRTITAFDTRFEVKGSAWRPDAEHVITATIDVNGATAGTDLQVWHVSKDGQFVRISNVGIADGKVSFAMDDDGTYILVERVSYVRELTVTDGATYRVTVSYNRAAGLPDGVQLVVREIEPGTVLYFDCMTKSLHELGAKSWDINYAKVLDIELLDPVTGMKYQPSENVAVRIETLDAELAQSESVDVVHFGMRPETVDAALEGNSVVFETDGFSAYVVCAYTVDFQQGEYTYSIAGESEIMLSELLEKLGVTEFVLADVADVSFSNPALLEVTKVEATEGQVSDWKLRSIAPFSTEEALSLTLADGQSVEIRVTDAVELPVSGTWDNGADGNGTWVIDENGVMTISGTGKMKDYGGPDQTPWANTGGMELRKEIKSVVVENGITRIGDNVLARSYNMSSVDVVENTVLTTIGKSAFKGSQYQSEAAGTSLISVNFSGCDHLTTIQEQAFRECKKLKTINFSNCALLSSFDNKSFENCTAITDLDISGTLLSNACFAASSSNNTFNASKKSLVTLKANSCTNISGALNLSEYTALTTLELSGCTGLTSLTVPSNVETLDISGCTNLDTLNLSTCTKLTTVRVGNRNDLTNLSWLTLPSSVTTLDASGFTSLTSIDVPASVTNLNLSGCTSLNSIDVPASVTNLNVSGCTGLTALDLSNTSLTTIDVSNNALLTALKLPETVSALNVDNCPKLVIYFDGNSEEFATLSQGLNIPDGTKIICWDDYTYTISRNATVTLNQIFSACNITAINSDAVQNIAASDTSILQVDAPNKTVTSLKSFTEPQTLTLTLTNGVVGTIKVACAALTESSNLNEFLDNHTVFMYEGETLAHQLSDSAILKQGDALQLNLSFSEIPGGQDGERQLKLLEPLIYTLPVGLTVDEDTLPETVTLSIPKGEETRTYDASVAVSTNAETGTQTLTVTGSYGNDGDWVSESSQASLTLPVTIRVSTVPAAYTLGNNLTLSAVLPRNPKVASLTASAYDEEYGTVTYTAVVEAENDIDDGAKAYPVTIADLSTGASPALQFVSGSYTYAHKAGFTPSAGAPATQVNGGDAVLGSATDFPQFPLTVAHMYDGDTITLTYTAKVLKGTYDKDAQQASIQNTVTLTNNDANGNPNPSNNTGDDAKSVTTGNIPYTPIEREYITLDGSWAYWKVKVNPNGFTLNSNKSLTLADTFDDRFVGDAKQSIDYSSIKIESTGVVTYDYSDNIGTFIIPDCMPATITYRTRITAQPGEAALFRGTAVLKDSEGNTIASSMAGITKDPVVIYPSATDVADSDTYMVKLYVYGENAMQQGIEGAEFILLDANQRALEYKVGPNKGQPVTFTTDSNGYANIELHEEDGDVSIEKNTGYYLEMMHAMEGYKKDNTLYSFMITDDPAYSTGGFYKYFNGDTMKVRLYPPSPGLNVSIRFSGSYALSEEQQNNVTAVLQKLGENDDWVEVERHPYTDSQWGSIRFDEALYDESLGQYQNIYRVVEENQNPWDLPEDISYKTTYYSMVNTGSADPFEEPQVFTVTSSNDSVNVVIDNRYEEPELAIIKMDKHTGEVLPGAVFSVFKVVNGTASGDVVTTYTTDQSGELIVRGGEEFESETLYGIKETTAPENYYLPLEAEWHYFYFCNDDFLEPRILENLPEGATAVNLTDSGDKITVDNQRKTITVPVMKLWQGASWPNDAEVVVGLYQSVGDGEEEAVLENGRPRTVTLTREMPYNNTAFTNLPSRDEQNRNIVYSIKEESINGIDPLAAGYIQEYGTSSAGVYVVRNKPATSLTVMKEWYDFNGNRVGDSETLARQSAVTFDVYRSTTPFVDSNSEDGITNADMMAFVGNLTKVRKRLSFGASNNWSISIQDLDKQDDVGNLYYYYVLEAVPSFGNELYEIDEESGTVTIKNQVAPAIKNLTVTKAALKDDPRPESLESDFEFTLKLKKDDAHPIRSWQVYTDPANSENNLVTDWNGEAHFTLKPTNPAQQSTPGASIALTLPDGVTATITEAYHSEYTVETSSTTSGTASDNGRTFTYDTSSGGAEPVTLTYTNTLRVICKVVDNNRVTIPFETLKRALNHIRANSSSFTNPWTIYMLEDYTIPVSDEIDLREGENLILTTASTGDSQFPFKGGEETGRAVITRGGVGGSMLTSAGTLTLENICLDGGSNNELTATGDGGLIHSTGVLNLNDKTTLRNSTVSGKGGAVYAEGTVNIPAGVQITGNAAPSASALYMKGTLNMTGGSITGNTGATDGAVVVENTSDVVNLSGSPVIFDNTNAQNKAANLYIGVDSDNIVNVIAPGLAPDAHIGISAMEGHVAIGEQFATVEFEQTQNLGRFTNDMYGYRGKLKDGTSTNVVWDGLKISITKVVAPVGANPNDRFTIVLSSPSIIMSTYVIDGTLDYAVSAARLNRPGRITLRNVKADDAIDISPLPVGEYTIAEEASNYTPSYSLVQTGSGEEPSPIEGGTFVADNDSTVSVTNARKLAPVNLTKALDDRLVGDTAVDFEFAVQLTEADGSPVAGYELVSGTTTDESGIATFTMSPTDAADNIKNFLVPVGATMTITETANPDYQITASAHTVPTAGETEDIEDLNTTDDNVFAFQVSEAGAEVSFENERKLAEIELSKTLVGKVSKVESFTFTLTLTKGKAPVANYAVYRDEANPENNITTNESGVATIPFIFGEDETEPKSIPLTIPDGIKLKVEETDINGHPDFYTTTYSVNGESAKTGKTKTIDKVTEEHRSIAFTNTRKTTKITVKNTVNGYSGNVVPFTYTATVTDGGENQDDYDANDFTNGMMAFELATGLTKTLTVPYGATLTVTEGFIVGYGTTVKRGGASAVEALSDTFVVTANMSSSSPLLFTNNQLIGLQLINNTSTKLENVTVTVGANKRIYRVNADKSGQVELGTKTAALDIEPGKMAILEVQHDTSATAEQDYSVSGSTPAAGYYYTIINEPSFHESANPAIQRVYDTSNFEVKGKLRYSVQDSTVTFTEQPLVSFDSNGGTWTTEMDGYRDRDGDRKVYQKAVTAGEKVAQPTPHPIYPTAEGIAFLGWTSDEDFAKQAHAAGDDVSEKLYDFEAPVNEPLTLYAIWARDPSVRTVSVKNGLNTDLTVTVTLTSSGRIGNINLADSVTTDKDGTASMTLGAGDAVNLSVPDGVKLAVSAPDVTAYSTDYTDADGDEHSFTINKVEKDGTISFIGGICKITDANNNILYDGAGKPAVYTTLAAAFTAYAGTLYTDASHSSQATGASAPVAVKLLVDEYDVPVTIAFPSKTMTLTTAGKDDTTFPYVGVRDRATIYRSEAGKSANCFTLNNANSNITLTSIVLDGGSEHGVQIAASANGGLGGLGGLINMSGGTLNVTAGTTLRNVEYATYNNTAKGGAINVTGGTLNVNAGLFSNLHAYQGGAICVTGGTLNITGTARSTQFKNCYSEKQDGGAIYYSAGNDLLVNGGEDKDNPGIVFTGCEGKDTPYTVDDKGNKKYTDGSDGGAIYATTDYNKAVTVKGCSFMECSAKTGYDGSSTGGYGGGAINAYHVNALNIEACTFEACDTLCGGGAIVSYVKDGKGVSIKNSSFVRCNCKAQGGALAVYQLGQEQDPTETRRKTKLYIENCSFNNCSSGTSNGSGGAIQCYVPCMEFIDTSFADCWAGKEGGAVNNYFAKGGYGTMWAGSYLKVSGCHFIRCRAEDRYQQEQPQHYGGAINTKVLKVEVEDSTFEECVSTLREGGALHLGGITADSSATISGCTFKNCMAKTGGGAIMASTYKLTVSDSFFYGCQAFGRPESKYVYQNNNKKNQNGGGAISHSENSRNTSDQATTTITNCVFSVDPEGDNDAQSCSTATNGGAVWTRAETVNIERCTINGCEANENGGGIYLSKYNKNAKQNATINGAKEGETIKGTINGCEAVNGSAVYVEDKATFSGSLSISDNSVSDVNGGAIQTVDGGALYFEDNVKVENNTCSTDSTYDHDVLMQIDGNTIINTTSKGLGVGARIGVYVPDQYFDGHGKEDQPFGTYHNSGAGSNYLDAFFNDRDGELYGYQGAHDNQICWGIYICKITDAAGNTLKRPNGRDAIYQRLSMALDEFEEVKTAENDPDKAVYIKMLVENYDIRQDTAVSNFPVANVTLTTASKTDQKHPYRGTEGTVSTISRNNNENPLFDLTTASAIFQLQDITLDGRKNKVATKGDFKLITANAGEIVVNSGTTLQYAKGDNGAAITGVQVTINGDYDTEKMEPTVKITDCMATGRGGAISTQNLTITNSSEESGEYGTAFTNCTSGTGGGAIYVNGTTATMAGTSFTDCRCSKGDGGVLLHENTEGSAKTEIQNCAFFNGCALSGAGGAVHTTAASLTVDDSSFDDCRATTDNGGAINHTGATAATITDTTFSNCETLGTNQSLGFGGSVFTMANTVTLTGDSFQKSTAINNGGALYCASSADGSAATISGTTFENCSTTHDGGSGGAIYSMNKTLTLQDYIPEGSTAKTSTAISACTAPGFSGAVHMGMENSTLTIKDNTVISGCYADKGGAIYLPSTVTMNLTASPELTQNGYIVRDGNVIEATAGACIYLVEGSRLNLSGSPKFSRNILPNRPRIANGGVRDNVRQDIFLAGYASETPRDTNATSIYVVGELTGETIWVWPEMSPHKKPNEQFAKIDNGVTVSADSLSKFRNALADGADVGDDHDHTDCTNGEYLAGVQVGEGKNVYWDKMYIVSFKKIDNKAVRVPGAGFTLYSDSACKSVVATAFSADGEDDIDTQGKLLERGIVEFSSIRIGAYYMKETTVPTSFKDNSTTYLVLVGSPYLSPNEENKYLWEGDGPLNVTDSATLVARHTKDTGRFYGVFPLDENNKAVLRANLASNSVGIENIRNDYQASFMKVDGSNAVLPGAAFTIYTAILDDDGQPETFEDGYPKLMRWSRDGENYPAPVVSADGTAAFKDKDNKPLPKGMVYFRDLPLGTYYLLETAYPERDGSGRRTYYVESDRVFRLEIKDSSVGSAEATITLSEWKPGAENDLSSYEELPKDTQNRYKVSNQEAVCKLTDKNDNLLYAEGHQVWENNEDGPSARRFPAIYPTLEDGFDTAQSGSFVYANGNVANVMSALKLKVLKDFTISRPVTYNSSRKITFTTAETRVSKDRYIFSTTRTSDTGRAQITRAYNEDTSNDANAGALITLADGADMTLQSIRLIGRANRNGRAIHVTGSSVLSILSNTMIERFTQTAVEGSSDQHNVQGGAILLDDGTSLTINGGSRRTAILENNSIQNSRVTGDHTGADGGAIAVGANCTFSITNAQFRYNSATSVTEKKGNGGAVSINKTRDADEMMKLPIYNVVFTGNKASYQGGALRVAENCNLIVDNCTFTNNKANTSSGASEPGEGGAIAVLSKADSPSVLTINGGTFTGNSASGSKGGAVKIGGFGMLTLSGSLSMSGNSAAYGGAVTIAPGAQVTMTQGTIKNNTATGSGGAFYVEGTEADKRGSLIVNGGSITDNKAAVGSAIYAKDFASVTVTNASVTGNKASGTDGGAINVGGPNARLHFGGAPTVFDNFGALGQDQQMNLVLSEDTNEVINTTEGGLGGGVIGVYVVETTSKVFEDHGLPGKPFGTFGDTESRLNPQVFRSDHALSLYGVRNESEPSDKTIYWVDVICKLTDANDKLLYQDVYLTINGKRQARKAQAVYARITAPSGADQLLAQNGFNALRDGFDAAQDTLYVRDESKSPYGFNTYSKNVLTTVKLKMLRDVALDKGVQYQGSRKVTFTTAEAGVTTAMRKGGDFFAYVGESSDGKALITRGFGGGSMVAGGGTALTLSDITLDGARAQHATDADGGIVNVASAKSLIITDGATLRNSATTGDGGAVYAAAGSTVTMSGGTITGNTAANGAGIYLPENSVLKLSGSPSFGGTGTADATGTNPSAAISGPVYDAGIITNGNYLTTTQTDLTNGQQTYGTVRQDIYVAGYANSGSAANSIVVAGAINGAAGSVWVWAEELEHYEMLKQFAVFEKAAVKSSLQNAGTLEGTMRVFRNARADSDTLCGADYLTGQEGDNINELSCIYWTGGFDFVFRKVDGFGKPLNGAIFTLYKANAAGTNILMEDGVPVAYKVNDPTGKKEDARAKSAKIEPANAVTIKYFEDKAKTIRDIELYGDGLVTFEKIPPATYFLVETGFPSSEDGSYKASQEKYRIVLDGKGWYTIAIEKKDADGKSTWQNAVTTQFAKDENSRYTAPNDSNPTDVVNVFDVMNVSPTKRKVILRKVGSSDNISYSSLEGAKFQIFRYDGTQVSSGTDIDGNPITTFTSGSNGVYFIDTLPCGIYYLYEQEEPKKINGAETSAYSGNAGKWFVLTIPNPDPNPDITGDASEVAVVEASGTNLMEKLNSFVK